MAGEATNVDPNNAPNTTINVDPAQTQVSNGAATPAMVSLEAHHAMLNQARSDEKNKLYSTIEDLKKKNVEFENQRKTLETQMNELQELADKDLPKEEKARRRFESLERKIGEERQAREQEATQHQQELRATRLETYKERAIRTVQERGEGILPELVGGRNEDEINASVMIAKAEYTHLRDRFYNEFQQQQGIQQQYQQQQDMAAQVPAVQSPYYTPPASGFPSPVNPVPVVEGTPDLSAINQMTSEQAVRSGLYAQQRGQLLNYLKSQSPNGGGQPLGTDPRMASTPSVMSPVPHVSIGGGVMQPQGHPTGPALPPGHTPQQRVVTQPQPMAGYTVPQPVQGQVADPRAMAMEAIGRTNSGQNPLLTQASIQAGIPLSGAMPMGDGSGAMQAYAQRFQPTPPISNKS